METTILIALIGTFSSVLLVVVTKYKERIDAIAQSNRERKIPIYEDILKKAGSIATRDNKEMSATSELTQKVAAWASTDVLVLYLRFQYECDHGTGETKWVELFSDMVLAIRKDLGYKRPRNLNDALKNGIGAMVLLESTPRRISQQSLEPTPEASQPPST
jgi:hypothetical protein